MANSVVHFEVPFDDKERAKRFYASVFDWEMSEWPMPGGVTYTGAVTTPVDETTRMPKEPGAINGAIVKRSADVPSPVVTMNVNSVDQYLEKIAAAGGRAGTKGEVPEMGAYGYAWDSEGNVIGLWQDYRQHPKR